MRYSIGLDLGVTSVGWSVLNLDKSCIEKLGVRIFTAAEHPKDGSSLALPRRLARGMRRRIRRKAHRIERIKNMLVKEGLLSEEEMSVLYNCPFEKDPYLLRVEGLDRSLDNKEWIRVLIHIAKRRGFKSNRKNEGNEKQIEAQKLLSAVENNRNLFIAKGYRTVGEMFLCDENFIAHKRNKTGDYSNTVSRELLANEIKILFTRQREFNNPFASIDLEQRYLTIFLSQRSFLDEEMIERMVGRCTLEPTEKRAPKNSYTSERFVLLTKINNLRLLFNGEKVTLNAEQRNIVDEMAYTKSAGVTYKQIRKELSLSNEFIFAGLRYNSKSGNDPENTKFVELVGFHSLKKAISTIPNETNTWHEISKNIDSLDQIFVILTLNKTDDDIRAKMKEAGFDECLIEAVLPLSFNKMQHLSIKAMKKLIPHLERGCRYDEACTMEGYSFNRNLNNEKQRLLPEIPTEEIRNPVVIRALTQTRKVLNAIISLYGSPERINIELARDIAKPFDERKKIQNEQENYRKEKEKTRTNFVDTFKQEPTSLDLLKFRLWREQNGCCPYTQKYLEPIHLFEPGYTDIDHIIPYSRCFDDSLNNKVLVSAGENRNKGNRIPFEYLGGDEVRWNKFSAWVEANTHNWSKRQRLLKTRFSKEDAEEVKERHLNDTRYIARFISMFIEENLKFADSDVKKRVVAVNGQITAYLRTKWGLVKVRENGDLHHVLDATVIATVSSSMIRDIANYAKYKELYNTKIGDAFVNPTTGELEETMYQDKRLNKFPMPWDYFREELLARINSDPITELKKLNLLSYSTEDIEMTKPIFVSRMPNRKITGKAHEDTIKSAKYLSDNIKIIKKPLLAVNLTSLENMFGKERNYKLYCVLKERLEQYGGDPKKAFVEKIYKPTNDGSQGPIVKSIKIVEVGSSGVAVNNGIAENSGMIRIDIFTKNSKYYIVPVYIADRVKNEMPMRAIVANKKESDWDIVDSTYKFCFSLYPNDLIRIEVQDTILFGYYRSCHRGTAGLTIEGHDRSWIKQGVGIKLAKKVDKYQVDMLGNYYLIKGEKRFELAKPGHK